MHNFGGGWLKYKGSLHKQLATSTPDRMPHYLESCDGRRMTVRASPQSRQEAINLIHQYFHHPSTISSFRFTSTERFDVSCNETYVVETFTLGLRHYGDGTWGVTEASHGGGLELPADFHPTPDDVLVWLRAAVMNLGVEPTNLCIELDHVDDFHVLQVLAGTSLLKSITWNMPAPSERLYQLPRQADHAERYIWGDAFIVDIQVVREAVVRLKAVLDNRNGLGF